jgi:hypothetical protein
VYLLPFHENSAACARRRHDGECYTARARGLDQSKPKAREDTPIRARTPLWGDDQKEARRETQDRGAARAQRFASRGLRIENSLERHFFGEHTR